MLEKIKKMFCNMFKTESNDKERYEKYILDHQFEFKQRVNKLCEEASDKLADNGILLQNPNCFDICDFMEIMDIYCLEAILLSTDEEIENMKRQIKDFDNKFDVRFPMFDKKGKMTIYAPISIARLMTEEEIMERKALKGLHII